MAEEIDFTVKGNRYHLDRSTVISTMQGVDPEHIQTHSVEVDGTRYPVKQVFGLVTGLDRLDFTSAVARQHLGRLGFRLRRQN